MWRCALFAIVETGGKQYKVSTGQTVLVDRLPAQEGEAVELDRVLLLTDGQQVVTGTPTVPGARVIATVLGQERGKKVTVFKFKAKVRYRRKRGHRQGYTRLHIREILPGKEG